jgi:hypothetical protein
MLKLREQFNHLFLDYLDVFVQELFYGVGAEVEKH